MHKNGVEHLTESRRSASMIQVPVSCVILEEVNFFLQSVSDAFLRVDVLLTSIDDTNIPSPQWYDSMIEKFQVDTIVEKQTRKHKKLKASLGKFEFEINKVRTLKADLQSQIDNIFNR